MTLSRLIHFLLPEQKVIKLKATWLTKIFVWLDVVSFIVQAGGGSMMSNSGDTPANIIRIGQQVYMTGVGLQAFFIFIFLFAAYKFHRRFRELSRERFVSVQGVNRLAWTLYIVLVLILVSAIISRLQLAVWWCLCRYHREASHPVAVPQTGQY